jgi:dTDP-4-dehydrorhamnose reductase
VKIAITGANGLFGHGLVAVIGKTHDAVALTRADADLRRAQDVRRVLTDLAPEAIVHAAAVPDPDVCEANPEYAFEVNVKATDHIVDVARELSMPVALISTDAVFDGLADSPRTESDPTSPISVYGKTKLLAENSVAQLKRYWIFRVSVLFGPGKANFVSKGIEALRGGRVYKVARDQVGTATYTLDAATKIIEVIEGSHTGLFHLSNTGVCSRLDLIEEAATMVGVSTDNLVGRPMAEMGRLAPRPKHAVLEMAALNRAGIATPRPWQEALSEYLRSYRMAQAS